MALTRKITFEMHYNVRYQSRGSFREEEPGSESRLFGKTGGAEQYDLLLRLVYRPLPWLNGELSQQSFISRNLSESQGVERITSETERNTFAFRVGASHDFGSGSSLSFNIRRSLTSDQNRTNTFIPTPAIIREDDLWQVTSSFRTFFDI
jgi:hypothetical protein